MTIEQILLSYLKSLYYINNKLRHKYSRYSTISPYLQHRIGMDLELARTIIENELIYLAMYSQTKIPVLRKRTHKSNIESLTTFINSKITNSPYKVQHSSKEAILHNATRRYHQLFDTLLFPKMTSNSKYKYTLEHSFPYLMDYTKLFKFYHY